VLAANWAHENAKKFGGDPDRLMAGGDSSGANISAVLALLGKAGKAPKLSKLILFYGVYGCVDLSESESAKEFGQGGFVLPVSAMNEMMKIYLPDGADPGDMRIAPGLAEDLTGMPPSIIVSAEFDPLRDDSREFARRLEEAGNEVEYIEMSGMMHGFILYWQRFHRAKELIEKIGGKVKALQNGINHEKTIFIRKK
jgi:acetyl esterase